MSDVETPPAPTVEQLLDTSIFDLNLSARAYHALTLGRVYDAERQKFEYLEMKTVADIVKRSKADLMRITNLGKVSASEIETVINAMGLKLAQR